MRPTPSLRRSGLPVLISVSLVALVTALVLLIPSVLTWAQGPDGAQSRRWGVGQGLGWRWAGPSDFPDLLELTSDQREQLDGINRQTREQLVALQSRARAAREELTDLLTDNTCDPQRVFNVSQQIAALERELESLKIHRIVRQRRILTNDQLRTLRQTLAAEARAGQDGGGWQRGERGGGGGMGWGRDGDPGRQRGEETLWDALLDTLEADLLSPTDPTPSATPSPSPSPIPSPSPTPASPAANPR